MIIEKSMTQLGSWGCGCSKTQGREGGKAAREMEGLKEGRQRRDSEESQRGKLGGKRH